MAGNEESDVIDKAAGGGGGQKSFDGADDHNHAPR
jgi:hypothetical protein